MARPVKSEYEKMLARGMIHTRKRAVGLSEEEKAERRKTSSRLAMEARRRATAVLISQHKSEYDDLYEGERNVLRKDPRYQLDQSA